MVCPFNRCLEYHWVKQQLKLMCPIYVLYQQMCVIKSVPMLKCHGCRFYTENRSKEQDQTMLKLNPEWETIQMVNYSIS